MSVSFLCGVVSHLQNHMKSIEIDFNQSLNSSNRFTIKAWNRNLVNNMNFLKGHRSNRSHTTKSQRKRSQACVSLTNI